MRRSSYPLAERLSGSFPLSLSLLLVLLQFTARGSCHSEVSVVWTVDGVSQFTLQDPLVVTIGDTLTFVYNNTYSNIWFQTDPQQYEECDCNTEGVWNADCSPRALLYDCLDVQFEANLSILIVTNTSVRPSFEPGQLYFFVSYSQGLTFFHACSQGTIGGECVSGLKLAVLVEAEITPTTEDVETTTVSSTVTNTSTTQDGKVTTTSPMVTSTLVTDERETTASSLMVTDNTTSSAKTLNQITSWLAVLLAVLQLQL